MSGRILGAPEMSGVTEGGLGGISGWRERRGAAKCLSNWMIETRYRGTSMVVLIVQVLILAALFIAVAGWWAAFPYPSPLLRRWLPPRKGWPELQIRGWLKSGNFHPAFLDFFNRDPERNAPPGTGILAPADGLITGADVRDDIRYLVIALSFWDMHVQRSPCTGTVRAVEPSGDDFMDGEGREFAFLREKRCPVQQRLVIGTNRGDVAVRLITSLAARRIETWVREGDRIERGQRIGRILLGSTVVLELPASMQLLTRVGERVRAGETIVVEIDSSHA